MGIETLTIFGCYEMFSGEEPKPLGIIGLMNRIIKCLSLALGLNLAAAGAAFCADDADDFSFTFGLGPGVAPEYEGANEYRPVPTVVARARWGARYFVGTDGTGFRADVVGSRFIEAGPALGFRFSRNSGAKDKVIALLPKVGRAIEVGGFLAFNFPMPIGNNERDALTFDTTFLHDVAGGPGGYTVRAALNYRGLVSDHLLLQVGPFTTYASDKFMSSYFDITPAGSASSGLSVYDAGAGFKDVGVRANGQYLLSDSWRLIAVGTYSRFIGDAKDSPVISVRGSDNSWGANLALAYEF